MAYGLGPYRYDPRLTVQGLSAFEEDSCKRDHVGAPVRSTAHAPSDAL